MAWRRAELLAGIEHPGRTDAVNPRAVGDKGRLMHMPRQDDVWPVLLDPVSELHIAKISVTTPAGRRLGGRRVMDPDPIPGPALCGSRRELRADRGTHRRAVPPRTGSEQGVVNHER